MTQGQYSVKVGSRSYLMVDDMVYKLFHMLDKEIPFDVYVSKMLCGTNSAICFSDMEKTGNISSTNSAGANMERVIVMDSVCACDVKWASGKCNTEG